MSILVVANAREATRPAERAWAAAVVNSGLNAEDPTLAALLLRELDGYR